MRYHAGAWERENFFNGLTGGFPVSGLDKYIARIVRQGYSIAIAMQDESKERHIKEIIKVQTIIK